MASQSTVLEEARALISGRLAELEEERGRLERVLSELRGGGRRRSPDRPTRRAKSNGATPAAPRVMARRGRPALRAEEALKLVGERPGIGASTVAKAMETKPSNLYRVLGDLVKEGRLRKDGRNFFPVG